MSTALCIGCGCDESHACPFDQMGVANTCWCLRLDGSRNAGLCSSCGDLTQHWDMGGRAPLLARIAERFHRQVHFLHYDEAKARAWMEAPHPQLQMRSARDMILAGELEQVRQLVDQLRDGAYA